MKNTGLRFLLSKYFLKIIMKRLKVTTPLKNDQETHIYMRLSIVNEHTNMCSLSLESRHKKK